MINVKFFASLQEELGKQAISLQCDTPVDVLTVWTQASAGSPFPANTLCAVNMEYVKPDALVQDGDEVAFFPPVTGG